METNKIIKKIRNINIWEAAKLSGTFAGIYGVSSVTLITVYAILIGQTGINGSLSAMLFSWSPVSIPIRFAIMSSALSGVPFLILLVKEAGNKFERLGAILFSICVLFYFGIAFFPTEVHPEHGFSTIFWLSSFGLSTWLFGTGQILSDNRNIGLISIWVGLLVAIVWLGWMAVNFFVPSFLVPEYIGGVLPFGFFAAYISWKFYKGKLYE